MIPQRKQQKQSGATVSRRQPDGTPTAPPRLALSIRQPHAEAILRGVKTVETRTIPTKVRGRVFIYATLGRGDLDDELDSVAEYGITDVGVDALARGLIVGTVEIVGCRHDREYDLFDWQLKNPERLNRPRKPTRRPNPVWFRPW